jgi:hypothetical protein
MQRRRHTIEAADARREEQIWKKVIDLSLNNEIESFRHQLANWEGDWNWSNIIASNLFRLSFDYFACFLLV